MESAKRFIEKISYIENHISCAVSKNLVVKLEKIKISQGNHSKAGLIYEDTYMYEKRIPSQNTIPLITKKRPISKNVGI